MDVPLHDRLEGQVFLVSGANRGLGAQVTAELVGLGATVYAGARDPSGIEDAAEASDGRILPVALDVTDEASIEAAVTTAAKEGLHGIVNNAGIGDWHGTTLHTLAADRLDAVLATNLRGPMLMAKHALPHLLDQDGGRVINVSSGMGGLAGMNGSAPTYRISKTGINGLTAYLHGEYGMRGLISASVCPGWVRTDMGGENANRSPAEGAAGIVWACRMAPGAPGGRFWRDGAPIDW